MNTEQGADKKFILRRKDIASFIPVNANDRLLILATAAAERKTISATIHDMIIGYNRCKLEGHEAIIADLEARLRFFIVMLGIYASRFGKIPLK
jgi:hypothetical protein